MKIAKSTTSADLVLVYDNTLDGLLCAIFEAYRLRVKDFAILPTAALANQFFLPILKISTNKAKSNRIKMGLRKNTEQDLLPFLNWVFTGQTPTKEQTIFELVQKVFI